MYPVSEMLHHFKSHSTNRDRPPFFGTPREKRAGWIKRGPGINDLNYKLSRLVQNTDGESLVFPAAPTVHYGINDQLVDNNREPVSQRLAEIPFQGESFDCR